MLRLTGGKKTGTATAVVVFYPVTNVNRTSFFAVYLLTSSLFIENARVSGCGVDVSLFNATDIETLHSCPQADWKIIPDSGIAVGVIPCPQVLDSIFAVPNYEFLPDNYAPPQSQNFPVAEGDEVFICSAFCPSGGTAYQIVRFGSLALQKSQVSVEGRLLQAYLAEIRSWGGHQGSPVFVYFPSYREPGSVVIGDPSIGFLGLVYDQYVIKEEVRLLSHELGQRGDVGVSSGMAAVVPISTVSQILTVAPEFRQPRVQMAEILQREIGRLFPGAAESAGASRHAVFIKEPHWIPLANYVPQHPGLLVSHPYSWSLKIR